MSWGDHDTDLINKKLGIEHRSKEKISIEQEHFLAYQFDNDTKKLGYRDRDWFALGWKDGISQKIQSKPDYGYKNNFSKNLKIIRISFGLTMEELHNQTGLATQTIGKYEAGDTEPSLSSLLKLSEALSVSVNYLISADLKLEIKEL